MSYPFDFVLDAIKEPVKADIRSGVPRPTISKKIAALIDRSLTGQEVQKVQRLYDETKANG